MGLDRQRRVTKRKVPSTPTGPAGHGNDNDRSHPISNNTSNGHDGGTTTRPRRTTSSSPRRFCSRNLALTLILCCVTVLLVVDVLDRSTMTEYYSADAWASGAPDVHSNGNSNSNSNTGNNRNSNSNSNHNHNHKPKEDPACTIPRFGVQDKKAAKRMAKLGPVLLEGWRIDPNDWTTTTMKDRDGDYPQYLKDLSVQPLKRKTNRNKVTNRNKRFTNLRQTTQDQHGEETLCRLQGKDLIDVMTSTTEETPNHHDVLFFTNNRENAPFMAALHPYYTVPAVVQHIQGFEVFSAHG